MPVRLLSIASARPNFVKLAAVHHAFAAHAPKDWEHIIVHTGQHYDPLLSDVFFKELAIPEPHENLAVKGGVSNEETVAKTKEAMFPILRKHQPNLVLVYGDVSGALGGAEAAHELGIPVAHIEAGLRSFDEAMPEERNRRAIDHIAQLLFVTEQSGMDNLQKEKMAGEIHFVGNTMIDTLVRMSTLIKDQHLPSHLPKKFGVVTLHRPSNVDRREDLKRNIAFLNEVAGIRPLVFPIHPRTRDRLYQRDEGLITTPPIATHHALFLIQPLGYLPFLRLMLEADFILTDSGGMQEEAAFLKKKCFTLRKNTERPSTVETGCNVLIDLQKAGDRVQVLSYAADPKPVQAALPSLWDGRAGERIMGILNTFLLPQ